jgi:serine protease Do
MNNTKFEKELTTISENLRLSNVSIQDIRFGSGSGSGVIWNKDGIVITNSHVVKSSTVKIQLSNETVLDGQVIKRDSRIDLAALKIDSTNFTHAKIGDSHKLRVGEFAFAVGNPLGEKGIVTTGIIHAVNPKSPHVITDVSLAPGNSGGALANSYGEIIGINTAIVNGLGLAIASHTVEQFIRDLDSQPKPYLGVTLQPVLVVWRDRPLYGLQIVRIEPESPAQIARLRSGDILTGTRGKTWQTPDELYRILNRSRFGDGLLLDFLRNNKPMIANIVICNKISLTTAV